MIDRSVEIFLRACKQRRVDFSRTVMLGRQQLDDLSFAEPFFKDLGASSVDSIDASTFEGATIVADLNKPLPQELRRRFSVVIDGGTLEHVFDIATALRSCLDMVELGGHYVTISPANNWPGHGFYQFSPELIFRSLSSDAGFQIRAAFVAELRRRQRWYAIPDPLVLGGRLYWRNPFRTHLVALARRVELVDLSAFTPQQSDYVGRWQDQDGKRGDESTGLKAILKGIAPTAVLSAYTAVRQRRDERLQPPRFQPVAMAGLADYIR